MGRPRFNPTQEQRDRVEAMAGFGIRHEEIARLVINPSTGKPIDDTTLRIHFRLELDTGVTKANTAVASKLYKMATEQGNVTAMIWWTKARMGWREATDVNVSGTVNANVKFIIEAAPVMKTIEAVAGDG
jgi:hypothetical protein